MKLFRAIYFSIICLLAGMTIQASAQTSVGINTTQPNSNAVLELVSPQNNQGLLIPQLTTVQRSNAGFISTLSSSPNNNGLLVFDLDDKSFYYWEDLQWVRILSQDLRRILSVNNSTEGMTITGLPEPIAPTDVVTKKYVDDTVARIIMNIENIENIVNDNSVKITEITDSIISYNEHFNEYWDSIVRHSENFTTLFDSINIYRDYFTEIHDSIYNYNEHFNEYWDSIVKHSENFTTLFDSINIYRDYFTEIHDSIIQIQQIFEKAEFNLLNGQIYIGGADDKATNVAVSGDVLIDPDGTTHIQENSVGDFALDKSNIPISGFASPLNNILFGDGTINFQAKNLMAPSDANDAATKQYIDDSIAVIRNGISAISARNDDVSDSIDYLFKTGKFYLQNGKILIGGTNDTAMAISPLGDISFDNLTGDVQIKDEAIVATDISGITTNGSVGQVLVTKADGSFEWQGKLSGGMSDDLQNGYLWLGNVSDKAQAYDKGAVPISGFASASTDVSFGDGATNFKLINVSDPANAQDAATKNYVDTELALKTGEIFIGVSNTTEKVLLSGDVLVSATGVSSIQNGVVNAGNLDAGGTPLTNGTANQVLVSDGLGNFAWHTLTDDDVSNEIQDLTITGTDLTITGKTSPTTIALGDIKLNEFSAPNVALDLNSQLISNLATPIADKDATTKRYVDSSFNVMSSDLEDNSIPRWDATAKKLQKGSIWDDGSEHVIIGSTTDSLEPSYNLEVVGTFKTMKIYHSSDERWKKNIETLDSALTKVMQLRGVTYDWRTDEFPEKQFSTGTQIGLIAQEVETILPELVNTGVDGYKAVEYANVVAVLIEAMKAQQLIINGQNEKIKKLENENSSYGSRLDAIEKALEIKK